MQFRTATIEDWPSIVRLLTEANLPLDGAKEALPYFLLAFDNDGETFVGCAAVEQYGPDVAFLRSVAIRKTAQGQGLGTALVERLIANARTNGIREIWLLTTTAADYFPRFGFQPVDRETAPAALKDSVEFRHACPASATAMRLVIERVGSVP